MDIVTKLDAKSQGKNRYFDNIPCKSGHISEKYVRDGYCCQCKTLNEQRNSASRLRKAKLRYSRSKNVIIAKNSEYVKNNKDIVAFRQATWRSKNKQKIVKYQKDNAGLYAFHAAKRRKKIKTATPSWADMNAIKEFYLEAARLTKETGIRHEVDHIIPITNDNVSGLHCEFNLQILTKTENLKKHNRI